MKDTKNIWYFIVGIIVVVVIIYLGLANKTGNNDDYSVADAPNQEIAELFKKLKDAPNDKSTLLELAIAYHHIESYDKEFETYDKLITLNPTEPLYQFNLGTTYKSLRDYDKAITHFEEAVRLNHKLSFVYLPLLDIYEKKDYRDKVNIDFIIGELDRIIAEGGQIGTSSAAETHMYLGRIYKIQGDYDKAEEHYKAAQELLPEGEPTIEVNLKEIEELRSQSQ